MRDPLGLNERLFARWYPLLCERAEKAGQAEVRARLLTEASGRTLELGAGAGVNVPHYGQPDHRRHSAGWVAARFTQSSRDVRSADQSLLQ